MEKNKSKFFLDSALGKITVDEKVIWDLIHTKDIQRLREIKQLAGTNYLYPSAEHSRFVHSLGVYEIARRIIEHFGEQITEQDRTLVLCSALLHDVGHGPFSHIFEKSFSENKHEIFTTKIIRNPNSEINKVLRKYNKDLPENISLVIEGNYSKKWINKIISSEIDVDRIDYLIRDDNLTKAGYSTFNLDWMIKSFQIVEEDIVFDFDSISIIESFLIGRYHMFKNVYSHPKELSFQVIFQMLINRIEKLIETNYDFSNSLHNYNLLKNSNLISYDDFYKLNDSFVKNMIFDFSREKDKTLNKITNAFLQGRLLSVYDLDNKKDKEVFYKLVSGLTEGEEFIVEKLHDRFYEKELDKLEGILLLKAGKLVKATDHSIFLNKKTSGIKIAEKNYGYFLK